MENDKEQNKQNKQNNKKKLDFHYHHYRIIFDTNPGLDTHSVFGLFLTRVKMDIFWTFLVNFWIHIFHTFLPTTI